MTRTWLKAAAAVSVAIFLVPGIMRANDPVTGAPPFGSITGGPFDWVDNANLNVHFNIPVLQKAGRGLPLVQNRGFDSWFWHPSGPPPTSWYPYLSNPGWGWSSPLQGSIGDFSYVIDLGSCDVPGLGTWIYTIYKHWRYLDAKQNMGYRVAFPNLDAITVSDGSSMCPGAPPFSVTDTAVDGSGFTITATGTPSATLYSRSGIALSTQNFNTPTTYTLTDTNGNQISATWPDGTCSGSSTFTDTLGTSALTVSGSDANCYAGGTSTYTYTNATGGSSPVQVTYTSYTLQTNFGCSGINEFSAGSVSLVSSITLPDNTSYSFTYEVTPGDTHTPHWVTGRLASLTLPTGGTISYSYTGGNNGIICSDGSTAGLTRTTPDGAWTYSRSFGSGAASTTTMTDPQGNQTVMQLQGIYETERQVYKGSSSSGTLLDTIYTCYNGAAYPCNSTAITLPITQIAKTNSWAGGQTSQTVTTLNTYGLPTEVDEYGYGNNVVGSLVRKITTSFGSLGNNINDRPATVSVYAAGGSNPTFQTTYTYDQGTVTATSGTPQHISLSGSRGNPTTTTYLVSGSTTISTTATYFDTGKLQTVTDSKGNQTTYAYGTSSCGNSWPTSISLPLSLSRSQTWNCNGGLVASETDENGQTTSFSYDLMNRPSQTNFPDGGWNLTTYTGANQQDTYTGITDTTPSSSCTSCKHDQLNLDSQGRQSTGILVSDPDGRTTTSTVYDSLGRVQKTSNPYRSTSDPTYGFDTRAYDVLNRVTSVTHQDSNVVSSYYGSDVGTHGGGSSQLCVSGTYGLGYPLLTVDEMGMKHQEWTDALGRIIEADEPDSSNNMTLGTCHVYDVLNNLTQTVQGSQTRTYSYDGLSRKTSETLPEAGNTNFYYTSSGGALCSGNPKAVCRRTDARSITTTYAYDGMNRLTSKTYSDSTPTANFYYDESSVTVSGAAYTLSNTKGRLSHTSSAGATVVTIHSYDQIGRTQDLWQCTPYNCPNASIWHAHYTYDLGGDLSSWQHPNGETITQAISNAKRITRITSSLSDSTHPGTLAQNIYYAPQGAVTSLKNGCAGTGCTQRQETYDYNNRLQPVRIQLGTSSSPNANACSVYNYYSGVANRTTCSIPSQATSGNDGTEMGHFFQDTTNSSLGHTAALTYDNMNRLVTSVATGSATHNLTFSYDRYGNMTCVTNQNTNGPCPNYTFSASKNQITSSGFAYDAVGNLTADGTGSGSHTYQWDAENRLKSIDSGSTANYTYNALGQRIEKLVGSTYTEYAYHAGGEELGENNRTNWTARVIPFAGLHLAHYNDPSGTEGTYFMHLTKLGSTAQATDYTGALAQDQLFYPWGQEWQMVGTVKEKRFAILGHRDTTETGLDPTRFRMFSSTQGRWLSKDPVAGQVCSPQTLNRYVYVRNSPTNLIDPRGTNGGDRGGLLFFGPGNPGNGCDPSDASCGGGGGPIFGGGYFTGFWWRSFCRWQWHECIKTAGNAFDNCLGAVSPFAAGCAVICAVVCADPATIISGLCESCVDACLGGTIGGAAGCFGGLAADIAICGIQLALCNL